MTRPQDALELLLPEAETHAIGRVRKVTHFLRLLSDDARACRAASVGIDLERARGELERQDRERLEQALGDLLRHHLRAVAGGTSAVSWGEPRLALESAWHVLDEFREELRGLASVPAPGEPALSVAARLIDSLERLGLAAGELALWRARLARLAAGVRAAEPLFRAELERCLRPRPPAAGTPVVPARDVRVRLAHVVECLLDRGALRDARALCLEHLGLVTGDARLARLLGWIKLCLGDAATGRAAPFAPRAQANAVLCDALVELRERRTDWIPSLAGRRHEAALAPGLALEHAPRSRVELGAALLAVFALRRDGTSALVRADAAPAWRERLDEWLLEREDACTRPGEPEHELVVTARAQLRHAEPSRPLAAALGSGSTLALALAPVHDEAGEVAGWLQLEFEHHLIPPRRRLAELGSSLRNEVLAVAPAASVTGLARAEAACASTAPIVDVDDAAAAACFQAAVQELGIKTSQRRWSGFLVDGERLERVAQGGEGGGLRGAALGGCRALARARATRGSVLFVEPDRSLSIDAEAGSGLVVALPVAGRVCALFAIESSRRRDFREHELARHRAALEKSALGLRLAQFRRWHRERFGFDLWFDAQRPDFRCFAEDLLAAARSEAPVVLSGPAGAGKQVLARWLHFEGGLRAGALRVHGCDAAGGSARLAELLRATAEGGVLLDDLEGLDRASQDLLLRTLEGERTRSAAPVRWSATTRSGLEAAVAAGALRADLAARLARVELCVPALADRREDVVPLVALQSCRFAGELGRRPPVFADDALALLWRQPWPGNVRELESFVYRLLLLVPERRIEAGHVLALAQRSGQRLLARLASRRPRRIDLVAALRSSRKGPLGRANKTRAAALLGWDPDTLVARMGEAGLAEETLDGAEPWRGLSEPAREGSEASEPEPDEPGT